MNNVILASAVVTSDREILSEFVSRQDHVHGVMGGIVPMKVRFFSTFDPNSAAQIC